MPGAITSAKVANANSNGSNERDLKSEVEYRTKLQDICNKIYAASNLDEILVDLKDDITNLFEAERSLFMWSTGKNGSWFLGLNQDSRYPRFAYLYLRAA